MHYSKVESLNHRAYVIGIELKEQLRIKEQELQELEELCLEEQKKEIQNFEERVERLEREIKKQNLRDYVQKLRLRIEASSKSDDYLRREAYRFRPPTLFIDP